MVAEYEASGLRRTEFCRMHGLALSRLNRYRKRQQQGEAAGAGRWLAVELSSPSGTAVSAAGSALRVVLSSGWRIEAGHGFDGSTLGQLLGVLEQV